MESSKDFSITSMESSKDLRDVYRHSHFDTDDVVIWQLRMHAPPFIPKRKVTHNVKGLDCLLALVRQFFALMPVLYNIPPSGNSEAEKKNLILRLAWLKVDYEHPAVNDEWASAKNEVLALFHPTDHQSPQVRFESLFNSDLMKETMWFREEYQLYRACLVKDPPRWRRLDWSQGRMFDESTMIVDRTMTPQLSFQQCINQHFGMRKTCDGSELLYMCAQPCIARVLYTTKENLEPLPFSTIKNIYIPVDDFEGPKLVFAAQRILYTLVAVVSLERDRLRLYSTLGGQIRPWPNNPIFGNDNWSLEDKKNGRFMLFYAQAAGAEPDEGNPEIAKEVDEPEVNVWQIADQALGRSANV